MELLFLAFFPLVPIATLWMIVRYGPIRSRWWRREHPIGLGMFVGTIAFLFGYVGPLIWAPDANQGPLLGIFYTGPIGLVVGMVWGLVRAVRRQGAGAKAT